VTYNFAQDIISRIQESRPVILHFLHSAIDIESENSVLQSGVACHKGSAVDLSTLYTIRIVWALGAADCEGRRRKIAFHLVLEYVSIAIIVIMIKTTN